MGNTCATAQDQPHNQDLLADQDPELRKYMLSK